MKINTEISNYFELSAQRAMIKIGDIIKGKIEELASHHVVVDAGFKSEAFIPIYQFSNNPEELEIGKEMSFYVMGIDNGKGEFILSRDKVRLLECLNSLETSMKEDQTVTGKMIKQVRGGYTILLENKVRAFLPNSLADTDIQEDITLEMKVLRVDYERNNVIVSRKSLLNSQKLEDKAKLLESLAVGDLVTGTVKNITHFGVFVDLGGLDALIHISDLSWKRIQHPQDVYTIGDKIEAKVLKYQDGKISLGVKQIAGDPWETVGQNLQIGDELIGRVSNITDYGIFINVKECLEGLVHSSEMSWETGKIQPDKLVKMDEEVKVKIISIDYEKKRISFSMKACLYNPWEKFALEHSKKDIVKCKIVAITDFGLFVSLAPKVDGLIHVSDLSWNKVPTKNELEKYQIGQEVEAVITKIEPESKRATLSIKQLTPNPFTAFISNHTIGQTVSGRINYFTSQNVIVDLEDGSVQGYLSKDQIDVPVHQGDKIQAKIKSFNKSDKTVSLEMEKSLKSTEKASPFKVSHIEKTSFGSLIKEKMEEDK